MIQVFKTDVSEKKDAEQLLKMLLKVSPHYKINFDLDDCDKILRIESNENIDIENIICKIIEFGYHVEILPD